jgi:hypothetical protein
MIFLSTDGFSLFCWTDAVPNMSTDMKAPEEKAEQYHVSVDWVLDGAQYNEWMNEEDYELEENGKPKVN